MDAFAQMNAGMVSSAEFFAPMSVGAIMAAVAVPGWHCDSRALLPPTAKLEEMMRRGSLLVFLLVLAMPLSPAEAAELWQTLPPTPAPVSGGHSGYAEINGIRLFHVDIGSGPPVVLPHGGLGNSEYFGNQARALAQAYRVILVDSRGHGRSTRDQRPFGYDLMADDVAALLDTLKIDKAAIVGWSDGAVIGLDLAMRHPERVTRIFAFGANTSTSGLNDDVEKNPTFAAFVARASREYAQLSATPSQYTDFHDQIAKMWENEPNWTDVQLRQIRTPVGVVDGEHDEGIKREHTDYIAATIPGAWLLILPNVSHFAFPQDPSTFNDAILTFLGEQEPGASTSKGARP
jgi:pimeloyl-ACP methyl ester carboxylesterase